MREVEFEEDNSIVSTKAYEENPEKYKGLIRCFECKKKSWFRKSFLAGAKETIACFAAHHEEGCERATSIIETDDQEEEKNDTDKDVLANDIVIDLDKTKHGSIEKSLPADKHEGEDHTWDPSPKSKVKNFDSSGYPNNRSLKQILRYLIRNPDYGLSKSFQIVANSGRPILSGLIRENLIHIPNVPDDKLQKLQLIWGEINNYTENDDGSVWLNYGSRKEPSLLLDNSLKQGVMNAYSLESLERFQGSRFLVVGRAAKSPKGKIIVRSHMPKYMVFVNNKE